MIIESFGPNFEFTRHQVNGQELIDVLLVNFQSNQAQYFCSITTHHQVLFEDLCRRQVSKLLEAVKLFLFVLSLSVGVPHENVNEEFIVCHVVFSNLLGLKLLLGNSFFNFGQVV